MKLQSKKARIPIAALGVAALCAGGLGMIPSASAATALTLNSGGTTPVVANLGYGTTAAANAAYALKVSGADENVFLKVASAPTGGQLAYKKIATNGAATVGFSTASSASDETQTVTITAGSGVEQYTLDFGGQTTTALNWDATAATVQAALVALSNIGAGDVSVVDLGGGAYTVSFGGALTGTNVAALIEGATVGVDTVTVGVTTDVVGGTDTSYKALGAVAATDFIYVTGNIPGTYTFRLFQDTNTNSQLDADDERSTALITLVVYDAGGPGTTTATTDDVAPVITANSPVTIGRAVSAGITYSQSLSLADARGSGIANGLANRLADLTFMDKDSEDALAGVATVTAIATTTDLAATYTASTGLITYAVGTPGEAGTITIRGDLKTVSTAADNLSYGTKTVEVASNSVDQLVLDAADIVGTVNTTGAAVKVKSGTAAVTYTATATNTVPAPDVLVSGAVVYFTLSGDNVADLTTNGTAVAGETHVYTATTNSVGVASLTVTSSATADTDSYTIDADTNGAGAAVMTTTYEDAAADDIEVTNTAAELTPTAGAGVSVTLKGKLVDQFEAAYTPAPAAPQAVTVTVPAGGATICQAVVTAGVFSCAYAPATAPTAGTTSTFRFAYSGGGAPTVDDTIRWASNTAAATVTLTTPTADATGVTLQDKTTPIATQANAGTVPFGNTTGEVTGTVYDATSTALAYKSVTLTGGSGVYFSTVGTPTSDAGDDLAASLTVVTNGSGQFSAFAFFTNSGTVKVTATSGAVMDEASVTTLESTDPYFVTVNDVAGAPGSTLIVTGTVKDAFLNPVPSTDADLSIGTSTLGAFGDSSPTTNANGVFSTTFTSGSNQSGVADLVATLNGQITNPTAHADWLANAGITVAHGEYMDTATVTVGVTSLTLVAQAKVTAGATGAKTLLSGTFLPNTSIDIYAKASGQTAYSFIDTAMTDAEGEWGTSEIIKKSTYFLARSSGLSSLTDQTQVYSRVGTITAKALGGGKVRLYANGDPNAKAPMVFYRAVAGVDPKLKGVITNSYGSATVTVTLPKGTRYVYATYQAAGTGKGISKRIAIRVK